MHSVTITRPADWNDARIYILSDLHIGDPHANEQNIRDRIQRIVEDEHGLCILNGDIMNTALRNSVSDVYGEIMTPSQQLEYAAKLLAPIRDKIIGADTGNHENRVYKNDGIDMMRMVCRELGCEDRYAPEGVLIFLSIGKQSSTQHNAPVQYTIYATHGSGGGRKEGAKAIRLADMASIVDADIMVHSHTHLPMIMRNGYFRVDKRSKTVKKIERLFVNDASAIEYGGYGQTQEYKPSSTLSPVIHIRGDYYEARAIL